MNISKLFLIKELNNAIEPLKKLPVLINKENIYLESGHVDYEFFTAILNFMSESVSVSNDVMESLGKLLGIEYIEEDRKIKKSSGIKWSTEEVLKNCKYENGVLKLPNVQLNPKSYTEVKKWIEEAGGKWTGGKIQGFTFEFNADRVVNILLEGKRCNLKKEYQFFETPEPLADWLVSLGGEIRDEDYVLEPSAGRGAIIRSIRKVNNKVTIDCFELMPENREFLEKIDNINICGEDFMNGTSRLYSKIYANPPFSKNQDIHHVRTMYESLDIGGVLCVITSTHWKFSNEKICIDFREWLDEINAEKHDIPAGIFKENGTGIATIALKILKQK